MAFAAFDGDGWYGFSIIFLFGGDFLFFFNYLKMFWELRKYAWHCILI